jgi:hypothetical protein
MVEGKSVRKIGTHPIFEMSHRAGTRGAFVRSVLGKEESRVISSVSLFVTSGRVWWKR